MNDNFKPNFEIQSQNIESKKPTEQTEKNLGSMLEDMKKWNVSKEKMEHKRTRAKENLLRNFMLPPNEMNWFMLVVTKKKKDFTSYSMAT